MPMRSALSKLLVTGGVAFATAGCALTEPRERVVNMYVAPNRAECMGLMPTQCMLVREPTAPAWTYFIDGIEGFAYEPGFRYTLRVSIRSIANPPADGSSLAYTLRQVLEKAPCTATFSVGNGNPAPPDWIGC